MELAIELGFLLLVIFGVGYFCTKIYEWYQKYRYEKYKDNSAEFIGDLFKLKMKWLKRGEYMYAKALDTIIGAEVVSNMPDENIEPETEEGRMFIRQMKEVIEEESKKIQENL